jgi:hypothetical protein
MMTKKRVFISYRRSDSAGHAGRLYDYLKNYFGEDRIFFDVDTIKPGVNFEQKIKTELDNSAVILVLIGNQWLGIKDMNGNRRLDDPYDYVHLEVEAALTKDIAVIPILLQGVPMPSENDLPEKLSDLSRRNAIKLSDENWNSDLRMLTEILKNVLGIPGSLKEQRIKRYRQIVFVLSLLGVVLSIANNFILPERPTILRAAIKFLYLVLLAGNTVFVTYLLVNMKRDLDRLGGIIISMAVITQMFVAWGGALASLTPIPLLIVAWLVNFVEPDD